MWQEFLGIGFQAGSYWLVRKDGQVVEVAYRAVSDAVSGRHQTLLKAMPVSREPFPTPQLGRPKVDAPSQTRSLSVPPLRKTRD